MRLFEFATFFATFEGHVCYASSVRQAFVRFNFFAFLSFYSALDAREVVLDKWFPWHLLGASYPVRLLRVWVSKGLAQADS